MSRGGRPPPGLDNMVSLKVDNLTYRTSPETLKRSFEKYGDVGDVYIPRDRYSRESRGFAFVRFYDKRDAEDAMDCMDGKTMDGRVLRVAMARYGRPTEERRDSGRRGGGGGGMRRRRRSYSRSRSRSRGRKYSQSVSRSRSRSRDRERRRSPSHERRSPTPSPRRSRSYSRSPAANGD
uniref:serine/arginine-rich splicing factor 2-like n=1 Tax=Ciona intestinalis TaxID=7719 RepID=UPI0000523314|nr:serine/arginine-rich splicing factor 2-like [Ciona intestinalis]XP_004227013.1 serine/arginine-rich splicing factor 2-like [Ciona intestinalis]|eukprot:XP_002129926.1 serine/arginine-rich splicing factor 2-like [Ciona intestinalis]